MLPYFVIGGVVLLVIWLGWRFYKYQKKQDNDAKPNNSKLSPEEEQFFKDYYRGMNG